MSPDCQHLYTMVGAIASRDAWVEKNHGSQFTDQNMLLP